MADPRSALGPPLNPDRISKTALAGGRVQMMAGWERAVMAGLVDEFEDAASTMEEVAKSIVPVRSGDLKSSIRGYLSSSGAQIIAVCEATEPYADFVEYGTGRRGVGSSSRGAGGIRKPDSYVHGAKPGMKAQPYLRPAMVAAAKRHFKFGATR